MKDRHENRCANTEALNRYEKEQDRLASLLEEFQELAQPHIDIIEEQIFHLNNKAEAFNDLDLESEIRDSVLEFLPYKKEKAINTCESCDNLMNSKSGLWCVDNVMVNSFFSEDDSNSPHIIYTVWRSARGNDEE